MRPALLNLTAVKMASLLRVCATHKTSHCLRRRLGCAVSSLIVHSGWRTSTTRSCATFSTRSWETRILTPRSCSQSSYYWPRTPSFGNGGEVQNLAKKRYQTRQDGCTPKQFVSRSMAV
ncbi:hypothetical protein B0H16DRAFT_1511714, partial [Mycena metata]